jgi:hypothetical protein
MTQLASTEALQNARGLWFAECKEEGLPLRLCGAVYFSDSVFKQRDRHCEPTGRANARPMTGSAKQSILSLCGAMDCFAALAMTVL